MCKVLTISNHKGGVGKTSLTVTLAGTLTWLQRNDPSMLPKKLRDKPVLVVDTDPQANTTEALGIDPVTLTTTILDFYLDPTLPQQSTGLAAIADSKQKNIQLIPSSIQLEIISSRLYSEIDGQIRLREILKPLKPKYSMIIVDTPPSLGIFTQNAILAADDVLVPITLSKHAIMGVANLLVFLQKAKAQNPDLKLLGLLINGFDRRYKLHNELLGYVQRSYGDSLLKTIIPTSSRIVNNVAKRRNVMLNIDLSTKKVMIKLLREIMEKMDMYETDEITTETKR